MRGGRAGGSVDARMMPRLRKRKVYGSLTSISLVKMFAGKGGAFGGRPCIMMRRERSPPR